VSGARESLKLLGALTDQGETFFVECESNFNSKVTIHFLQALQQEFGEKLAVILDHATYFTAIVIQGRIHENPALKPLGVNKRYRGWLRPRQN
jgi:hypothetical protein